MQPVKLEKGRNIRGRISEWRRTHELDPTTSHKQMRTKEFYAVKLEGRGGEEEGEGEGRNY